MSIRQRTRRACQSCRRRKRRCDGRQPCQSCAEFDYECFYAEATERPAPTSQVIDEALHGASLPDVVREQASTERGVPATQQGFNVEHDESVFLEPNKRRFYDANSAISFPRALSMSFGSRTAPRVHSFAYNVGIMPEFFFEMPNRRLADFMDLRLAEQLTARYLDVVNALFKVVEDETFSKSLRQLWTSNSTAAPFETLAAFVILLGSFFTVPSEFPRHEDLLQHAQDLLDRSDFRDAPSLMYTEHLQAWILRTIYVRCTTRPNIAWLSSSMALHIAESIGLHRELDTVSRLGIDGQHQSTLEINNRRRMFWLAWILNRMISFEIGRSPTLINEINIRLPEDDVNKWCNQAIQTYLMLYPDGGHVYTTDVQGCLDTIASSMLANETDQPLLVLIRADLALGLYREMHKLNAQSLERSGRRFVTILRPAYVAVQTLLEDSQPWWWIASVPFQSVCSALSIGKSSMIQLLPEAMQVLHAVNQRFDTKMTNEADQTAKTIVRAALHAKNEDATILRSIVSTTSVWGNIEQGMDEGDLGTALFWGDEY